ENAPLIKLTATERRYDSFFNASEAENWRIQDISFEGSVSLDPEEFYRNGNDWKHATTSDGKFSYWAVMAGSADIKSVLLMRVKVFGTRSAMSVSRGGTTGHDQLMMVDCDFSGTKSAVIYTASEQLVLMGSSVKNTHFSHVVRLTQAYRSVLSHNIISGSSLSTDSGQQALKLHGPFIEQLTDPDETRKITNPSRFIVISNNVFGSSGPLPVGVGPQNGNYDERLSDIIIEKNRFLTDYGTQSPRIPSRLLNLAARDVTVRNNVFDGTGSENSFVAVTIDRRGSEPPPENIQVYNNTIYKSNTTNDDIYKIFLGVDITSSASHVNIFNNLLSLPSTGTGELVSVMRSNGTNVIESSNLLTDSPLLADPDNSDPLSRNYSLLPNSPAIDAGETLSGVLDDYSGNTRIGSLYDLGAFQRP
ncbi:MAG: hypothetical protein GY795_04000, partial [Desulfobacterales bacterium]|nr:hypothetical protein [Desulfobacterales bacterium]